MASKKTVPGDNKVTKPKVVKGGSKTPVSKKPDNEEETVSIDLTNPADLLNKLEQLDLDDEEADALLKRAYEVNRELKKQLEIGRKAMDRKISSSTKKPTITSQRRPGSNRISVNLTPGHHPTTRQQTRMASATHSAGSRKQQSREGGINRPGQTYSYHSYKDKTESIKSKKQ